MKSNVLKKIDGKYQTSNYQLIISTKKRAEFYTNQSSNVEFINRILEINSKVANTWNQSNCEISITSH